MTKTRIVLLVRLFVIVSVLGSSCWAAWVLTNSWAGVWLTIAVVGYLLDIKIKIDEIEKRVNVDEHVRSTSG